MKSSALTGGAVALAANANLTWAASDTIRVGVVGCGKRGAAAAQDCVKAAPGVKVVAVADALGNRAAALAKTFSVAKDHCFGGLDAYKKLMALDDVDLVILATPPGFRPQQFAEAVEQGKHVFMEAPAAVCSAGVEMVAEAAKKAADKKLTVIAGTQRRHDPVYVETMKRIHGGAIGDIVSAQCYCNTGAAPVQKRQAGESDVEWQIRNWRYIKWLSGDIIVTNHVHNIDVINWAFQAGPEMMQGLGNKQGVSGEEYGNTYDHFGVEFVYPNDVLTMSICRAMDDTDGLVAERVAGTKGTSNCCGIIQGENAWQYTGPKVNPYAQEQVDLIKSIRAGAGVNEGRQIADSTLTAIMARESSYMRMRFKASWFVSKSTLNLLPPASLTLKGSKDLAALAVPGKYQLLGSTSTPPPKPPKKGGKKGGRKDKKKA